MRSFSYAKTIVQLLSSPGIVRLLTAIHECDGKVSMLAQANKKFLAGFKSTRRLLDAEAFCRAADLGISETRLRALICGRATAKNPRQQMALAYWKILNGFPEHGIGPNPPRLSEKDLIAVDVFSVTAMESVGGSTEDVSDSALGLLSLIGVCYRTKGSERNNARLITGMIESFNDAVADPAVVPLLAILCFVLDYRYVQGEIRGLRQCGFLPLMYLLNRYGFVGGTYSSLETALEQRAGEEKKAFEESSANWEPGQCDYLPYVRFLLETILRVYQDILSRVKPVLEAGLSRSDRILGFIGNHGGNVSRRSVIEALPDISVKTIERHLNTLVKNKSILKFVSGRDVQFRFAGDPPNKKALAKDDPEPASNFTGKPKICINKGLKIKLDPAAFNIGEEEKIKQPSDLMKAEDSVSFSNFGTKKKRK